MVKYEYSIHAIGSHGGYLLLKKDIGSREEAQQALAQIVDHINARRTKFVSIGNIVFDPTYIMAYEVEEHRIWEDEDHPPCDCPVETPYDAVTVIDMDVETDTETVETTPGWTDRVCTTGEEDHLS